MKLLFDFLPILLFFVAYKMYDLYVATAVAMVVAVIQVMYVWIRHRRVEKMLLITMAVIVGLGGLTLLLDNELFIKWKPSVVNWAFGAIFLGSQYIGSKPLLERMLQSNINLPPAIWRRMNGAWALFFISMGFLNLYVIYNFDTDTWVDFKLFGMLGLTLLFVVLQAIYMSRHMKEVPNTATPTPPKPSEEP